MAKVDWDQTQYEASKGFEIMPKGRYPCVIESITEKAVHGKDAYYYECLFQVVKGDFKGRKLWARLNVKNPSDMAQQIGREQFKALCIAAGKENIRDTSELHGKYAVCLVDIERGTGGYADKNTVRGFMSAADFRASAGDTAAAATATAAAKPDKAKPAPKNEDADDDIPF